MIIVLFFVGRTSNANSAYLRISFKSVERINASVNGLLQISSNDELLNNELQVLVCYKSYLKL